MNSFATNSTSSGSSGASSSGGFTPELILIIVTFALNVVQTIADVFSHVRRFESRCCGIDSAIRISRSGSDRSDPEIRTRKSTTAQEVIVIGGDDKNNASLDAASD